MGIAALILGIISIIVSLIPFCGYLAILPALIGIILGIISIAMKKSRGLGIAGLIISILAMIILVLYTFAFGTIGSKIKNEVDFSGFSDFNTITETIEEKAQEYMTENNTYYTEN